MKRAECEPFSAFLIRITSPCPTFALEHFNWTLTAQLKDSTSIASPGQIDTQTLASGTQKCKSIDCKVNHSGSSVPAKCHPSSLDTVDPAGAVQLTWVKIIGPMGFQLGFAAHDAGSSGDVPWWFSSTWPNNLRPAKLESSGENPVESLPIHWSRSSQTPHARSSQT